MCKKMGLDNVAGSILDGFVVDADFAFLASAIARNSFNFFKVGMLGIKCIEHVLGMVLAQNSEHGPCNIVAQSHGHFRHQASQLTLKCKCLHWLLGILLGVKEPSSNFKQVFIRLQVHFCKQLPWCHQASQKGD